LLGVKAEALRANICSKSSISLQRGRFDPKLHVEGVAPPTIFFSETRLNDLSYGIKIWTDYFRFVTIHVLDRRTDRQTEFSSLDRVCIPCSAVKINGATFSSCLKIEHRNLFINYNAFHALVL